VHGGYHYTLGLSRRGTEWVMLVFSVLMLGSMHAIQWNHLQHHQHCLAEEDIEGMGANRSALGAILLGPLFPLRLHAAALVKAPRVMRRWIVAEIGANAIWVALVATVIPASVLPYHLLAMALGQCLTAFFAVWTVHHGCVEGGPFARTIRGSVRSTVTFNMFFHLEHHLFPQVPTAHLPRLARRLDRDLAGVRWPLAW